MRKVLLALSLLAMSCAALQADNRSFKRGFSENSLAYVEDLLTLAEGCTWFYNWGTTPPASLADYVGADKAIEFCPMAWNGNFDLDKAQEYYDAHPNDKYLLGFNEPNFADQANMTPLAAAEKWRELEAFADKNSLYLVAPALNYSGSYVGGVNYNTPESWLDAFISEYKNLYGEEPRLDYLALHCYMDQPSAQINYVEEFAKRYGKQVWLTEFCAWEASNLTADTQQQYMLTKLRDLELSDYVARYAWFKARGSNSYPYYPLVEYPSSNTGVTAGTLTDLGFAYIHMSTFDLERYYELDEHIPVTAFVDETSLKRIQKSNDPLSVDSVELYIEGSNISTTYQVNVPDDGDYVFILRASREDGNDPRFTISDGDGKVISSGNVVPPTGGTDIYGALQIPLSLSEGPQRLTLKKENYAPSTVSLIKVVKASDLDPDDPDLQTIGSSTGIDSLSIYDIDFSNASIYTIDGKNVGQNTDSVSKGIYILHSGNQSRKVLIH